MIQLPVAAQWFLGLVSILTAFVFLLRTLRPFFRLIAKLDEYLPALFDIADQFDPRKPGQSLADRFAHLESEIKEIKTNTEALKKAINGA